MVNPEPLPHRPLGATGIQVAPLSLGTVKLGRDQGVKYPAPFSIPTDAQARELLDGARALGINLLDTAPAYGTSETRLGHLLRGERAHWVLCTKVGEAFDGQRSSYDFTPEHCAVSVARSLKALQTDYLDIVLIHSDGADVEILEHMGTLEALVDLKHRGLIRAVGISHKTVQGAERAVALGADVLMATFNRDYTDEGPVIREAAAAGCGVLIKKALASGHAGAGDLTFVAAQPGVHSIVVGTTRLAHLRQNAAAVQAADINR